MYQELKNQPRIDPSILAPPPLPRSGRGWGGGVQGVGGVDGLMIGLSKPYAVEYLLVLLSCALLKKINWQFTNELEIKLFLKINVF